MDAKAEKIALFRYGLIAPLVLEPLPRGELTRRAEEIAARHYDIPASKRTSISVDTLLDWALRYRNGGFEALAPQPRQDRGQSRTITPQLADLIERLKRENPHRTGTTLLRELALSSGQRRRRQSPPPRCIASSNSAASRNGNCSLHRRTRSSKPNTAIRSGSRTCSSVPMSSVLAAARCRPCLHATLDDASRLIPHAQFYASQGLDACLDCLRQAIAARGVPVRLYMDNAKIYRSPQLARIAASIGMLIVHTPPYQPEGRGKSSASSAPSREQFLNNLDRKQTLSLEELNERLWAWLDKPTTAPSTARLGTTPLLRWQRDIEHIRQLPPATDLPPSLLSSPGSPGAPRLHFSAAKSLLRSAAASGRRNHRSAFRSSRPRCLWRSISRGKRKARRASSIPSSTASCPRPNQSKAAEARAYRHQLRRSAHDRKRTRRSPPW